MGRRAAARWCASPAPTSRRRPTTSCSPSASGKASGSSAARSPGRSRSRSEAFPRAAPSRISRCRRTCSVNRQVLADPDALRDAEVWAELRDGTPLVTAAARGNGRIVLFHVTADPRWSNLPLSGAFVDMLNAIVDTAGTVQQSARSAAARRDDSPAAAPWKPVQVLDGYGDLDAALARRDARRRHQRGKGQRRDAARHLRPQRHGAGAERRRCETALTPAGPEAIGWRGRTQSLEPQPSTPIWPWLLAAAAVLAILDGLAVLFLSGRLTRRFASAASRPPRLRPPPSRSQVTARAQESAAMPEGHRGDEQDRARLCRDRQLRDRRDEPRRAQGPFNLPRRPHRA